MSTKEVEIAAQNRRRLVYEYLVSSKKSLSTSEIFGALKINRSVLINDLNELRRYRKVTLTERDNSYYWRAVGDASGDKKII